MTKNYCAPPCGVHHPVVNARAQVTEGLGSVPTSVLSGWTLFVFSF